MFIISMFFPEMRFFVFITIYLSNYQNGKKWKKLSTIKITTLISLF